MNVSRSSFEMKLLIDANLSPALCKSLRSNVTNVEHVRNLNLSSSSDETVWNIAKEKGWTIVSKDSDFYHRSLLSGSPPKIVWIRRGNCSTATVEQVISTNLEQIADFVSNSDEPCLILY